MKPVIVVIVLGTLSAIIGRTQTPEAQTTGSGTPIIWRKISLYVGHRQPTNDLDVQVWQFDRNDFVAGLTDGGALEVGGGYTPEQALREVLLTWKKVEADKVAAYGHKFSVTRLAEEDRNVSHIQAAVYAKVQWEKALGHQIPMPYLEDGGEGSCSESVSAVACIDHFGRIIFDHADTPLSVDGLRAVYMHEIGHLLGVHHIDGDVLMGASLAMRPPKAPTPAAVALAKLAEKMGAGPVYGNQTAQASKKKHSDKAAPAAAAIQAPQDFAARQNQYLERAGEFLSLSLQFSNSLTAEQKRLQEAMNQAFAAMSTAKQAVEAACVSEGKVLAGDNQSTLHGECGAKPKPEKP